MSQSAFRDGGAALKRILACLLVSALALAAESSIAAPSAGAARALAMSALWTFPLVLLAALLIAWAADSAQYLMSQGMALAILALLQTLPEFSVEAVLSWQASHDGSRVGLVLANVTGSLRLLVGVGMPMVYFVQVLFKKREERETRLAPIRLEEAQSVEVVFLLPPILYFFYIWWKGTLDVLDGGVLLVFYVLYMYCLGKLPPESREVDEDLGFISKRILSFGTRGRWVGVLSLFLLGGVILYASVEAFVRSMEGIAVLLAVPAAIFIQWVAPFLSEFPEKVSAFYWARTVKKAPMGLMNIVSSNVNQWTLLMAMIPFVWVVGKNGVLLPIPLDAHQRAEILLTVVQSLLAFLLLANMSFHGLEATGLFVLFAVQFCVPRVRGEITWVYAAWCLLELLLIVVGRRTCEALDAFAGIYRRIVRA